MREIPGQAAQQDEEQEDQIMVAMKLSRRKRNKRMTRRNANMTRGKRNRNIGKSCGKRKTTRRNTEGNGGDKGQPYNY